MRFRSSMWKRVFYISLKNHRNIFVKTRYQRGNFLGLRSGGSIRGSPALTRYTITNNRYIIRYDIAARSAVIIKPENDNPPSIRQNTQSHTAGTATRTTFDSILRIIPLSTVSEPDATPWQIQGSRNL